MSTWRICYGGREPFIDQEYRTFADREHTATIGSSLGKYYPILGLEYQDQIICLGSFHPLTGYTKMPSITILNEKLYADQRIYTYVGTEEADETDKTLMAGNITSPY